MPYVNYHPVFLDLNGKPVLIVGAGFVALEKIESLLDSGPIITVVAPEAIPEIQALHASERLTWVQKSYAPEDSDGKFLVVAATDDPSVNATVYRTGNDAARLTNSADDPKNCNFIMAARLRRGPMQVAISSAGCSPALAQRMRTRIGAEILTEPLATLAEYLGDRRSLVKHALPSFRTRQRLWESAIDSEIPELIVQGDLEGADAVLMRLIGSVKEKLGEEPVPCVKGVGFCPAVTGEGACRCKSGKVYLVGAGPGDPGLITIRAVQVLAQADVVLYDRLVNPSLLNYARPGAELIYAGKDRGSPGGPRQVAIHDQIIAFGLAGKTVVRLKGGDPFVFGRGGEEALALQAAGIEWEVIPGVSSAVAAPAAAHIPVTHRKVAPAYGVFAGQEADDASEDGIPWAAAALMPTAVFLMGVESLPKIVSRLIEHGRAPDTPVAAVSHGTLPQQEVVTGTLATIVELATGLEAPAAIIVGDVVRIRESLVAMIDSQIPNAREV